MNKKKISTALIKANNSKIEKTFIDLIEDNNLKCIIFGFPIIGIEYDKCTNLKSCGFADENLPKYDDHIHIAIGIPFESSIKGCINADGSKNIDNCNCEFYDLIDKLTSHPNFIKSFKVSHSTLTAQFIFSIPEEWKNDFKLIIRGDIGNISEKYKIQIKKVFNSVSHVTDGIINNIITIHKDEKQKKKKKKKN